MQRTLSPILRNSAFFLLLFAASSTAWTQAATDLKDMHWNEGAKNCKASTQPLLEQHAINAQTIILRENLCATFEAPFMYLLIGSERALLIDTGDVADTGKMPLAKTVLLARVFAKSNSPPAASSTASICDTPAVSAAVTVP